MKHSTLLLLLIGLTLVLGGSSRSLAQDGKKGNQKQAAPTLIEWKDEFEGDALNEKNWEQYSLEGGGTIKVAEGKLITSGADGSRFGVRTKKTYDSEKFIVSAKIASVSAGLSAASGTPTGNAILSILFDNTGKNRLEWVLSTEGVFEAWLMRDGKSIRLDGKNLGTKEKSPTLGIARRGDNYFFMLNGEVGLQKEIKDLSPTFRVMVYGFGASKDEWEMVSVITPKEN
ncbi:MAG: hypothetical protein R2747_11555 [Pyrinomonadaceae bacterium]